MRLLVYLAALGLSCLPLYGEQAQLKDGEAFQYSLYWDSGGTDPGEYVAVNMSC